jgi:hypothetical protein
MRVLVVISESWGEVDWVLPILSHIKSEWRAKIFVYFTSNAISEEGADYVDLKYMLETVCQQVVTPATLGASDNLDSISKPKAANLERLRAITGGSIDVLFHEFGGENFRPILDLFPSAQTVAFPHGTFFYKWIRSDLRESYRRSMFFEAMRRDTILLIGSELDREHFATLTGLKRIEVVGHPKLDRAWVNKIIKQDGTGNSGGGGLTSKGKILFLQYPGRRLSSRAKYANLNRTVFHQGRRRGLSMIVRRHPRQESAELREYVNSSLDSKIEFSRRSVLASTRDASIVICFPTSGCMDAVAAGIPVIEFFDFEGENWPTFISTPSGCTSIYRENDLVLPADTKEQLEYEIDRLVEDPLYRKSVVAQQYQSLARLIPMDGTGVARVCDRLQPR